MDKHMIIDRNSVELIQSTKKRKETRKEGKRVGGREGRREGRREGGKKGEKEGRTDGQKDATRKIKGVVEPTHFPEVYQNAGIRVAYHEHRLQNNLNTNRSWDNWHISIVSQQWGVSCNHHRLQESALNL